RDRARLAIDMRRRGRARAINFRGSVAPVDAPFEDAIVARVGGGELDRIGIAHIDRRRARQGYRRQDVGDREIGEFLRRRLDAAGQETRGAGTDLIDTVVAETEILELLPGQGDGIAGSLAEHAVAVD